MLYFSAIWLVAAHGWRATPKMPMMAMVTTRTESCSRVWVSQRLLGWLLAIVAMGVPLSLGASCASAAITTFGSPLSRPATLNTTKAPTHLSLLIQKLPMGCTTPTTTALIPPFGTSPSPAEHPPPQ